MGVALGGVDRIEAAGQSGDDATQRFLGEVCRLEDDRVVASGVEIDCVGRCAVEPGRGRRLDGPQRDAARRAVCLEEELVAAEYGVRREPLELCERACVRWRAARRASREGGGEGATTTTTTDDDFERLFLDEEGRRP